MTYRYTNSGKAKFEFEYLGKFETEFENILGKENGTQMGSIDAEN
jgi:hypothetical protein